jgi:hypothetical protein
MWILGLVCSRIAEVDQDRTYKETQLPVLRWKNVLLFVLSVLLCSFVTGIEGRMLEAMYVNDMDGIFNTVSYNGNSLMANGDTLYVDIGSFKCSEGACSSIDSMLETLLLNGEVKCVQDNASCVLDGEMERNLMWVSGSGSGTLILRALHFLNGQAYSGGGMHIWGGAILDIELCVFSNCRATSSSYGGGAIYIRDGGTANAFGTSFNGNIADSERGNDILNFDGTIAFHDTCPSPYSSNTPIQGKRRKRTVQFSRTSPNTNSYLSPLKGWLWTLLVPLTAPYTLSIVSSSTVMQVSRTQPAACQSLTVKSVLQENSHLLGLALALTA